MNDLFIFRATEDAVFAPGKAIESSLKNLAERRTDIFGVGEDAATEAEIGKKLGDDTEDETAAAREATAWDGHTVSAEGAVRAARAKITLDDQIKEINRQKGLMADKDAIGPSASGVQFNRHLEFFAQNWAPNWATFWAKFSTRALQV